MDLTLRRREFLTLPVAASPPLTQPLIPQTRLGCLSFGFSIITILPRLFILPPPSSFSSLQPDSVSIISFSKSTVILLKTEVLFGFG